MYCITPLFVSNRCLRASDSGIVYNSFKTSQLQVKQNACHSTRPCITKKFLNAFVVA